MGVLNATPDSFFEGSRIEKNTDLSSRVSAMVNAGMDILDIGGCSTRPGSEEVSEKEELERVLPLIKKIRKEFPEVLISIDTFRASVAEEALKVGADIIVLDILQELSEKIARIKKAGVVDIIIDLGFGFAKTPEQNFELLKNLSIFSMLEFPILCGFSRKSMISKRLDITVDESLNGTSILNTFAVTKGASLIRVHDVKEAKQIVSLLKV